jgi:dienelactone hydrolase
MIKPALIILFFSICLYSCQDESEPQSQIPPVPEEGLYITTQFEDADLEVSVDVPYSVRNNYEGIQYTSANRKSQESGLTELIMHLDVAVPPNATSIAPQPLIVYIHGGGFSGGSKEDFQEHALSYAKAGYVAATINYRLTPENHSNETLRTLAVNNAVEDAMNAIRFLKDQASIYHIDTSRIAVIGSSAGGGITLATAIGAEELDLTSDYPNHYAGIAAAVSTGATLTGDSLVDTSLLRFDRSDAPVLLFHNNNTDPVTGATWSDALATEKLIDESGNTCTAIEQPSSTHTVNLSLGGKYWTEMKSFLWEELRLYAILP